MYYVILNQQKLMSNKFHVREYKNTYNTYILLYTAAPILWCVYQINITPTCTKNVHVYTRFTIEYRLIVPTPQSVPSSDRKSGFLKLHTKTNWLFQNDVGCCFILIFDCKL